MSDDKITALIAWHRERAIMHSDQAASCWRAGWMNDVARSHEDSSARHTATVDALEASVQAPAVDREVLSQVLAAVALRVALKHDGGLSDLYDKQADALIASGILQDAAVLEREAEARGLEAFLSDESLRAMQSQLLTGENPFVPLNELHHAVEAAIARAQQVREGK